MKLSGVRIREIMTDCMIGEDNQESAVLIEGIAHTFGFAPDKIERYRREISDLLSDLPDSFQESVGGGMSFLNACEDRRGNQWTGMHMDMESLVCLGIATGKVAFLMPRDMWEILPGGMPYFVVKGNELEPSTKGNE